MILILMTTGINNVILQTDYGHRADQFTWIEYILAPFELMEIFCYQHCVLTVQYKYTF